MFSILLRDDRANIAALGAAIIAIMLGMGAFAVELGNAYLVKTENQRIADLTAIAAAVVYNAESNTTALGNAVANISQLNGAPSGAASGSVVTSPSGDGNNAILVSVTTTIPLRLARAVGLGSSMNVSASSWSEISTSSTSCMIGLYTGGNAIIVNNGSHVTGTNCALGSVDNLSLALGSYITASAVYTGGTIDNTTGITTTPTASAIHQNYSGITDPIASNSAVSSAFSGLTTVAAMANPTTPASTKALNFGYNPACPGSGPDTTNTCQWQSAPYSGVYSGQLPAGAYQSLTVAGGVTVTMTSPSASSVYTFSQGITNGSTLTLGAGNYSINGGITTSGGTTTTFTGGTGAVYKIGGATSLAGTVRWGAGGTNQYSFNGNFTASSGSNLTFGDGNMQINGNLLITTGPMTVGNGLISVNGYFQVDNGGSLLGASGTTQSVFNNGAVTFQGGSTVDLNAPATGAAYGVPGVVVASNATSAAGTYAMNFDGGASTTLSGVMYFPNASAQFTGGANTGGANCFEIVAQVINMSGGSATTSTCPQFNAGIGTPKIKLVQ